MMQILLIEDDIAIAEYIKKGLQEAGHCIEHIVSGKHGLTLAMEREFNVLIVDRMLPELDGLSIVKALRAIGNNTPILFLSALGDVEERVKA
jgi:two-component system OmpR family response regulator